MKKIDWKDITIGQFSRMSKAFKIENDAERAATLLSIVTGREEDYFYSLSLTDYYKQSEVLRFMVNEPAPSPVKEFYELGGKKYRLEPNVLKMSAGQFIDYTTLVRDQPENTPLLLATILLPEGKAYAEGYDVLELAKEFEAFKLVDALGICFFFRKVLEASTKVTLTYSMKKLKKEWKKEKDPERKNQIEKAITALEQSMDGLSLSSK